MTLLQIMSRLLIGSVCIIHHCFPSMEMEQAVKGIITANAPSRIGSALSTTPGMPMILSTLSFPTTGTATARSTISTSPAKVLVT